MEIAGATYLDNPDTAIVVCEKALEIANHANSIVRRAECYAWLGYLINLKGDVQLALDYTYQALEIQEQIIQQKATDRKSSLTKAELNYWSFRDHEVTVVFEDISGDQHNARDHYSLSLHTHDSEQKHTSRFSRNTTTFRKGRFVEAEGQNPLDDWSLWFRKNNPCPRIGKNDVSRRVFNTDLRW